MEKVSREMTAMPVYQTLILGIQVLIDIELSQNKETLEQEYSKICIIFKNLCWQNLYTVKFSTSLCRAVQPRQC